MALVNAEPRSLRRGELTHPGQGQHRPRPLARRIMDVDQGAEIASVVEVKVDGATYVEEFDFTRIILHNLLVVIPLAT